MDIAILPLNLLVDAGRLLPIISEHGQLMYGEESNIDLHHMNAIIMGNAARCFILEKQGKIIGYTFYLLSRDLFLAHKKQAECIAIYIKKEFRSYALVSKLMRTSETALKDLDSTERIIVTAGPAQELRKLYERGGYNVVNTQMAKEL